MPGKYFKNSQVCDKIFSEVDYWNRKESINNSVIDNKDAIIDIIKNKSIYPSESNNNSVNEFASRMVKTPFQGNVLSLALGNYPIIPTEVFQLTELNQLQANMAKIETVPAEIGSLVNLTLLNLSNNPIKSLPPEISKLTKLKTLNLKGTEISAEEVKKIQALLPNCKIKF